MLPNPFPMVIEYLEPHGLEPYALEGVDYYRYKLIQNANQLPLDSAFKIIATSVLER